MLHFGLSTRVKPRNEAMNSYPSPTTTVFTSQVHTARPAGTIFVSVCACHTLLYMHTIFQASYIHSRKTGTCTVVSHLALDMYVLWEKAGLLTIKSHASETRSDC